MGKSWNLKKWHFHGKIMEFCFSYPHFFSISEYILHNLFFVTCVSFLVWYLTTGSYMCPNIWSFGVKTIWANNNNLGKLHMQPKRKWSSWKNNFISWKNHGKIMEFCFQFWVGTLIVDADSCFGVYHGVFRYAGHSGVVREDFRHCIVGKISKMTAICSESNNKWISFLTE